MYSYTQSRLQEENRHQNARRPEDIVINVAKSVVGRVLSYSVLKALSLYHISGARIVRARFVKT